MSKITSITLIFNDESTLAVPEKYLGEVYIDDIVRSIHRGMGLQECINAGTVALEIFSDANEDCGKFASGEKWFERISLKLWLTAIIVTYSNPDRQELIEVPFPAEALGADRFSPLNDNIPCGNQQTFISDLGNLYIAASYNDEMGLEDFFNLDELNDAQVTDMKRQIMSFQAQEEPITPFTNTVFPDLYRWVRLYSQNRSAACIAMAVEDKECGWKFLYADPDCEIRAPEEWQYIQEHISAMLDAYNVLVLGDADRLRMMREKRAAFLAQGKEEATSNLLQGDFKKRARARRRKDET